MLNYRERLYTSQSLLSARTKDKSISLHPRFGAKYKNWTEERLLKAYKGVHEDGLSIRQASEVYNVPRSTLHDRLSGKTAFGVKSGPVSHLTLDEEGQLVQFLLHWLS